jgi:hypothetical protein
LKALAFLFISYSIIVSIPNTLTKSLNNIITDTFRKGTASFVPNIPKIEPCFYGLFGGIALININKIY